MPELPEVETIKRGLQKFLIGHTIQRIELLLPKQFHGDTSLANEGKIVSVERYGKGLVINLDNGYSLAIHVKMTGQLLYCSDLDPVAWGPVSSLPDKYTHVIFHLDNNALLYYRDMRQFGWVKVLLTEEVSQMSFFKNLGPEPLKDLTLAKFSYILQKVNMPIKTLLLDQAKIAGIGNIYANDALYLAKIHPLRRASSLDTKEIKALFESIEKVLRKGIAVGGASEWHYVDVLGGRGKYQEFFQVYRKNGTECKRCQAIIEKIKIAGRGTFFCPICQQ